MTVAFADSFDHYGTGSGAQSRLVEGEGAWTSIDGATINSSISRTGARCLRLSSASHSIQKGFTLGLTIGLACALYFDVLDQTTVNRPSIHFMSAGGSILFSMVFNPNGSVVVYGSSTSTTLGQSSGGLITAGSWNHFEIKFSISTTVGSVEVRLNGVTIIAVTDLNLGSTAIGIVQYRCTYSSIGGSFQAWNIDDVVLWNNAGSVNNDFIGPARVYTQYPSADMSPMEWDVVGAASGAAAINNSTPDDDTSYVQADSEDLLAEFTIGTLPADVERITSIHMVPRGRITDGGAGVILSYIKSDGEIAEGANKSLSTSYAYRGEVFQVDPDGDIQWTKTKAQNALFGLKRVS